MFFVRANLRHDNILPLYGACPDADIVCIKSEPILASCALTGLNPAISSDEVLPRRRRSAVSAEKSNRRQIQTSAY